jgi:serpin B
MSQTIRAAIGIQPTSTPFRRSGWHDGNRRPSHRTWLATRSPGSGLDLFGATVGELEGKNVTVSPASVAIALVMLEPGTVADAQRQLRELLRIGDPVVFHASMNALEQDFEARVVEVFGDNGDPGEIIVLIANAAFLQRGYPFNPDYLEVVVKNYGPVLNEVDFRPNPDAMADVINAFVADATNDLITEPIGPGVIDPATVLALVNALYLKASWFETFDGGSTVDGVFTTASVEGVTVSMMHGASSTSAAGDGWVGATKQYVGNLVAEFILPDDGRFDNVAGRLDEVFADVGQSGLGGAEFVMPRFETRLSGQLDGALKSLGLTVPYEQRGLLGIADDPELVVDKVIHETFISFDEEGTEAAAVTIVLAVATSAPIGEPIPVTLDRPFFYRIVDRTSGATLFVGRVLDPSAADNSRSVSTRMVHSERCEESVDHHGRHVVGAQTTRQANGFVHLVEVRPATATVGEMAFDVLTLLSIERPFEIVGDDLDELITAEVFIGHASSPPSGISWRSTAARTLLRARCRSTRWFASLRPNASQTSVADHPSTSRNQTTRRRFSGSVAIAVSIAAVVSLAVNRSSGRR